VVIVNETFARTFFPGVDDPVGRRIKRTGKDSPWITIVGLVADVRHYGLERPMRPGIYQPLPENPWRSMSVALRTRTDPKAVMDSVRAAVAARDPELPVYRLETMEEALRQSLAARAAYSWLLGVFAVVAVALALGGTYGVTTYLVTQRRREIGIRMALGAERRQILDAVLRGSLGTAAAGVALGLLAAAGAARILSTLLFGVPAGDLFALGGAAGLLLATALAANALPAWRASRIDPMATLRAE
jgi:predicted lysophospholipase L1 biosynthesis ABC-type transport system permease subunit